jgi:hypothetical protein
MAAFSRTSLFRIALPYFPDVMFSSGTESAVFLRTEGSRSLSVMLAEWPFIGPFTGRWFGTKAIFFRCAARLQPFSSETCLI